MIVTDHPDSTAIRLDRPEDVEPARTAALDAIARRRRVGLFVVDGRLRSGNAGALVCAATVSPGFEVVAAAYRKRLADPRRAVKYAVATARHVMGL